MATISARRLMARIAGGMRMGDRKRLADAMGVPPQAVSRAISGARPTSAVVAEIAARYGYVPADQDGFFRPRET